MQSIMGSGKRIVSWLKKHLLRKKRKMSYEITTGSVDKDNSKIMEKVGCGPKVFNAAL